LCLAVVFSCLMFVDLLICCLIPFGFIAVVCFQFVFNNLCLYQFDDLLFVFAVVDNLLFARCCV
jgi:hypothetical protein